ncbi:MAG TPA: ABC transporter permease [Gaiellaceae bacterium]|jgi:peptide/nickel transport system permease protein|nr:ABC transporter permease [Gaiellaceae bacterium]
MRVAAYFARRLATALFTLLSLILLTFILYWVTPSTPASFVYPHSQALSNYQIAHANHLLGLDRPKTTQFFSYLWRLLHGDFGHTWASVQLIDNNRLVSAPIRPLLFEQTGETLSIVLGGALIVVLLAVPLGTFSGTRVGTLGDRLVSWSTLVGICTHPLVLGSLLATYLGAQHLNWLPSGGYCPLRPPPAASGPAACGGLRDWSLHMILPWITFALLYLALYTRMVRASVADTLHEDFVRTARAKGASELRVLRAHVVPSATLRVLTMVGMEIGTAIGICIYIETAFGFQGLGRAAVFAMGGALSSIDLPETLGIVTMITLIVVVGNLVVDLLYAILDPRAGRETSRGRTKSLVGGVF